jgi:hypothetical protein
MNRLRERVQGLMVGRLSLLQDLLLLVECLHGVLQVLALARLGRLGRLLLHRRLLLVQCGRLR